MVFKSISQMFPPGFKSFDDGSLCSSGRWSNLWRRWLSWREMDLAFSEFCVFIEDAVINGRLANDEWCKELNGHLRSLKNRFFLFLIWANACGSQMYSIDKLMDMHDFLDEQHWNDFNRWFCFYSNDKRAEILCRSWCSSPVIKKLTEVSGVDIASSIDYYLLPNVLSDFARARRDKK